MDLDILLYVVFFFNDTATTEIYTLSLHDALPIYPQVRRGGEPAQRTLQHHRDGGRGAPHSGGRPRAQDARGSAQRIPRSEEHTSELQSRQYLVCRLLLEKKKFRILHVHYFTLSVT